MCVCAESPVTGGKIIRLILTRDPQYTENS